ncbi:tyrosinase family protein [Chromobacterium sphagni]|uniref:Tyrosinase copper-binding domain-containing protein n=1 Tax=Chromobacterium sphagni TaxID=1903179 RepID=A0ABX3CAH5_9NEIS|nr:tyrosinase family protein [Chromobacterium sphagni]OHX19209.1 hypothetical protein BI344_18780 [Chromobacterium sphagni]
MANTTGSPIRVRKDAWRLAADDPTLLWYARAVDAMRQRPLSNTTSWEYQAAVHGTNADPSSFNADQQKAWGQCQHATWLFLPWHRMFLGIFEQIVAATVAKLGGPQDWALPYWDYSDATNPNARKLPAAFTAAEFGVPEKNPLRVERDQGNDGAAFLDSKAVSLNSLKHKTFTGRSTPGGDSGFGGPSRGFNHSGDNDQGQLEMVPHDVIHSDIGGLMGAPDTAALDPIFWLHHANIDRLWEVWRHQGNSNPTDPSWLTGVKFFFHNAAGQPVTYSPQDVVDTIASPWHYQYDRTGETPAAAADKTTLATGG